MNAGMLKLLIHIYCHPPQVRFHHEGSEQFLRDCRNHLHLNGLIDRGDELAAITERGRVHVEALLAAPLPEQQWVSPFTGGRL